jgi:Xaa-Pro aminopeptidase
LDSLARYPLWQAGLDYAHGTGHGVGSFLSVHEGPQRISNAPNTVILQPGMILSNEPGYYKAGAYGIRIENLVVVTPCPREDGHEHDMLGFDVLTLVPIDRRLIELSLLTPEERQWVNAYHARVRTVIGPRLRSFAQQWLNEATADL